MSKGIAIHIAVDSPGDCTCNDGKLSDCEASTRALAEFTKKRGFAQPREFIGTARLEDVKKTIADAQGLDPGDILLLTFAGHGCQVPGRVSRADPDGFDENWCLSNHPLVDNDVDLLLSGFAEGVRIVIISESCHAGGIPALLKRMLRELLPFALKLFDSGARERRERLTTVVRRDEPVPDVSKLEIKRRPSQTEIKARVLLLAACRENQTSEDGLFIRTLLSLMKGDDPPQSYAALIADAHQSIHSSHAQKPGWAFDPTLLRDRPLQVDP